MCAVKSQTLYQKVKFVWCDFDDDYLEIELMSNYDFLKQLMTLPTVVDARLSPDKRWVAFVWYRMHENFDVFLVPSDGSQPPIPLTHTPEATELVSWTPDSKVVIVSEDHDGDEFARLYRVEIGHPLEMDPLTDDRPPYFIRGGMLSPNGRQLFYGANYDFESCKVIEPTWIYCHDLISGERLPIAKPASANWTVPELNKPGTHLIYPRRDIHPAGRQYWLVDVNGYRDEEILNFGEQVKVFADWHPDGEHIVFLSESTGNGNKDYFRLGVYHWPTHGIRWLIDDPSRVIESHWVTRDGLVVVDEMKDANHLTTYLDINTATETSFPRLPGNLMPVGQSVDGTWIALYYSATSPTELVQLPLQAKTRAELPSLTRVWEHTSLSPDQLYPAEDFRWKSVDGLEIQGWLYRAAPNPKRAIIYIHGGPTYHSENRLNPQIQYYLQRNFNVLDVNYRGSTGFGLKFRNAIKEDGWGGREQADIAAGAKALLKVGLAQLGKIGVTGTSYGGYSAWFQITHYPPEIIAAAAPISGMTDLVVDYQTTRPDLRPLDEEMMGGRPDQVPERYFERSPINFVQDIHAKLLIVQGALDPNVSPENVRQVRQRLDACGVPYEVLVFDDEGHGIIKPINQEVLYTRLVNFFEQAFGE
jgi:dipeptidyl aminopeptidase/acylaminoacyl peptidase